MENVSNSLKYTKILTKACPSEVTYLSPIDWATQVEINCINVTLVLKRGLKDMFKGQRIKVFDKQS